DRAVACAGLVPDRRRGAGVPGEPAHEAAGRADSPQSGHRPHRRRSAAVRRLQNENLTRGHNVRTLLVTGLASALLATASLSSLPAVAAGARSDLVEF